MTDLEPLDFLNTLFIKSGKFKVDKRSLPAFQRFVADHASQFAPDSVVARSMRLSVFNFERFWQAYHARLKIANLNHGKNAPLHSQHISAPVLNKYTRLALVPNVGNALISLSQVTFPEKELVADVNAYSRNRHPPEDPDKTKGKKIVMPLGPKYSSSLPEWMPVVKEVSFEGDVNRRACTENRILNGVHHYMNGEKLEGSIVLYTDRIPCSSCRKVISKFLYFHRDVKMHIIYAYPKEWWEGEYFEVGSLLAAGVDVTLVRKVTTKDNAIFWPDFWRWAV